MMRSGISKEARKTRKKKSKKETRDCLELPRDVMIHIFLKVGVIDVLFNAQSVCSAWRKLARDPQLYRCIDMWNLSKDDLWYNFGRMKNMVIEAINRSCGQLVDFSINYFGSDIIIQHLLNTSNSLKRLRLVSCYQVSEKTVIEALKKFPLLEEFALCNYSFSKQVIEVAGQSCPHLKYFRLNKQAMKYGGNAPFPFDHDDEALAIAANMPQLRHLHLCGNDMTNFGLQAVLDRCRYLKYLDLRLCCGIDLKGDMLKKCKGIKTLRLPNDSADDYEFDPSVAECDVNYVSDLSYEDYDNHMYGLLELNQSDYEDYGFGGFEGIDYEDF